MLYTENYSLLNHNTFGIPCVADAYGEYAQEEELLTLLQRWSGKMLHIGGGSNLLFLEERYCGLILHNAIRSVDVVREDDSRVWVRVGGGLNWDEFVALTLQHGWYGLENLSYIPGEVGASAVQNVGAYGAEAGEFIDSVECVNLFDCTRRTFTHDECAYAYRYSIFKSAEHRGRWAVTYVTYCLNKRFVPRLEYGGIKAQLQKSGVNIDILTAKELRDVIVAIRKEKLPDPKEQGSAGSFFKNPIVDRSVFESLQQVYPGMPFYVVSDNRVKIPAGWLIEQCGWKGRSLGCAGVHPKQALVLVNLGGAVGQDILTLCDTIRCDVKERFGIEIQPEVNFIGMD